MRTLILLTLIVFTASTPALAASAPQKAAPKAAKQPPYQTRPVFEPDGNFGFCIADYPYQDGRKLTVAMSPVGQINLGFTIPGAGFQIGAKYDLMLTLGEGKSRKVRAQAIDNEAVLLQMGATPLFRKKLSASTNLQLGTEKKNIEFSLPTMEPLLTSLDGCLKSNKGKVDPKAAMAEQAMPETLKALLVTAGFTDVAVMDMSKIPPDERPADYIWKTGTVLGGIRERRAPEGKSLSDLIALHMQGLKARCAGTFKADIEREKKAEGLVLRLAQASCAPPAEEKDAPAVTVAILFYLTDRGGFTSFSHEGQGGASAEAVAARDKLAKAILAIANQNPEKK
ncbi:MAG TPA: hypothetical protein DCY07_07520 [Rhodospirillaceae bacterium]|nr:hypothetical protein [Rhodospirillaceae bacterium]